MEAAAKTFFSSPRFAVAGASSDPSKFGHKIFAWYLQHNLSATPINPSTSSVAVPLTARPRRASTNSYSTVSAPSALTSPAQYSLSVITPPRITKKLLEDAKAAGVPAVWLQPGSFDTEILVWARKEWPNAAIGGTDVPGSRGGEGWCVLVDGEWGMELAGKDTKNGRKRKRDERL